MAEETKGKRKGVENLKPELRKQFTSEYQPSPEAKKRGWEELRKERLLTQNLFKALLDDNGLPTIEGKSFFESLVLNAKEGNAKAIDVVIKALEDQVDKSEVKVETNIEKITFK